MSKSKQTEPTQGPSNPDAKSASLAPFRQDIEEAPLTTNQGIPIENDQDSLRLGARGPTLMEDFHFREKLTHFDHERIPERVVHARGTAAHGVFRVYESLAPLTRAHFLQDPNARTPVFVRFSTVVGSRGSTDLARDVRGFATKFYTEEGNFDLVGNNIPVFFIQDGIKFPDLVHAIKPEPHNEIPQASSAHDTFWDFISLMPESMHMIFWLMSDRAIPRSYRMMEGFGVHTFRLVDHKGKSRFVKFHWKPLLGLHAVLWDEAQKISGKDPDFHRRDLWEAIESGMFPQYELGMQVIEEQDEDAFDFDLLDSTKIVPEELVPVRRVGVMTLNRNPDNFFAETEQVAFHMGNLVPGIDVTDDPLLQARLFSYLDTQLLRLGGPNFHEIPINRPLRPVTNNQRDGFMQQCIYSGRVSYEPNSLARNQPAQVPAADGGYYSVAAHVEGRKVRARSESFNDHFSQARLFLASQTEHERRHIIDAFRFELGRVDTVAIRERMVGLLAHVDAELASHVAEGLGTSAVELTGQLNYGVPPHAGEGREPTPGSRPPGSPALSMTSSPGLGIETRKIAVLAANGFDAKAMEEVLSGLESAGAVVKIVAPVLGSIIGDDGSEAHVDFSLLTASSVLFDAVCVMGGTGCAATLALDPRALYFVNEAFKHCKSIGATGDSATVLVAARVLVEEDDDVEGVYVADDERAVLVAAALVEFGATRHWSRECKLPAPV
jgi:catalase